MAWHNPWGWVESSANSIVYYPTTTLPIATSGTNVTDFRVAANYESAVSAKAKAKEPASVIEWLRRQVEEVTALAAA